MLHKTKAIVLHQIKYAESSVIVKIYTELFGLQSYLINSVRSKKSKIKAGLLQPLSLVDMVVYHKENGGLQRINELKTDYPFSSIPFHIAKSSIAIFIAEILYNSIKEEESNKKLFEFIYSSVKILDLMEDDFANFHLLFMIKLSKHLGFYPHGNYTEKSPFFDLQEGTFLSQQPAHPYYLSDKQSQYLSAFLGTNFDNLCNLFISKSIRKNLLSKLIEYYQLHLTSVKEIKSHQVLEMVMR